jgi:hypothetical protein
VNAPFQKNLLACQFENACHTLYSLGPGGGEDHMWLWVLISVELSELCNNNNNNNNNYYYYYYKEIFIKELT